MHSIEGGAKHKIIEQLSDHFTDNQKHMDIDNAARLLEELRVYEAELEEQNQQLVEVNNDLKQQQNYTRLLFDSLPVSVFVLDKNGIIIDINDPAMILGGFISKKRAKSYSFLRLLDSEVQPWLFNVITNEKGPTKRRRRAMFSQPGGKAVPIELDILIVDTGLHAMGHAIVCCRNLTDELALKKQQKLFDRFINNANAIIFAVDRDYNLLFWNKRFSEFHEEANPELEERNVTQFFPQEAMDRLSSLENRIFDRGLEVSYEYSHQHESQNSVHHFRTSGFPITGDFGEILGAGFITTDITENVVTNDRLRLLAEVMHEGNEGFIITDEKQAILSVNKAFTKITGHAEEDVVGKHPRFLLSRRKENVHYPFSLDSLDQDGHWRGEVLGRTKDGGTCPLWLTVSRVPKGRGPATNFIAVFSDISEKKEAEQHIEQLAYYDELTGAANRRLLQDRVEQLISRSDRERNKFVVCFLDVDHFKNVNDMYGHDWGDEVLKEISKRLTKLIRRKDTLCRLGGDEFIILFPDLDKATCTSKLNDILKAMTVPICINDIKVTMTMSVGAVCFPDDGSSYNELIQHADTAMYQAKSEGKNTHQFFESELLEKLQGRIKLENAIKYGLAHDEFKLHYQPQIELSTGKIIGCEALIRWESDSLGTVSPAHFIPVAEENGMILPISDWVMKKALEDAVIINELVDYPLTIAINICEKQLWQEGFLEAVHSMSRTVQSLSNISLEFELTEGVELSQPEKALELLSHLKSAGIKIALDDFGTGYSSLGYLKTLPIDVLKIDRAFVKDIGHDADDETICKMIISMASALDLATVAEGIETETQMNFLRAANCCYGQGFGLYKPMSLSNLQDVLRNDKNGGT